MNEDLLPKNKVLFLLGIFYCSAGWGYAQCPAPTSLGSTSINSTSALLYWTTGGASDWVVEYGPVGFTQGTGTTVVATNDSLLLSSIGTNVAYEFYVRDSCGVGNVSTWVGPISFNSLITYCDDFDSYTTGPVDQQSLLINGWQGNQYDSEISNVHYSSPPNSLFITTTGTTGQADVVAELNPFTTGVHVVKFDFLIPAGYGGYYNVLHQYVPVGTSNWAFEVYMDGAGTATVEEGSAGGGTIGSYSFTPNAWNTVEHIIDLDKDSAYVVVNGEYTGLNWQFSLGTAGTANQFNAVNFYSAAPTGLAGLMYFDNFCITPGQLNDVGIVGFVEDNPHCGDVNYPVRALVRNYGDNTIWNFPVNGQVSGGATANLSTTANTTIAPRSVDTVVLGTINSLSGGTFNFTAYTDLSADIDSNNDTMVKNGISILQSPAVDLGPDLTYCSNETFSATLNAQNAGASYFWNNGLTSQTSTISNKGVYWVDVLNSNGCKKRDSVVVTQLPAPEVILSDTAMCEGDTVALDAGNPGSTYQWTVPGETGRLYYAYDDGDYGVVVTAANGCKDSTGAHVTVHPLPVVDLGPDAQIVSGTSIILDAGNPGATYEWNHGNQQTKLFIVTSPGTYSVTVTDANGCMGIDTVEITLFDGIEEVLNGGILLYPTIVDEAAQLEFSAKAPGNLQVMIYTMTGQMVSEQEFRVNSGSNNLSVKMQGLSQAMYLVRVSWDGKPLADFKVKKM